MPRPADAPPPPARETPWVRLRSARYHPLIYQRMIDRASPDAQPGDAVSVYDKQDRLFGHGLYNPRSQIVLRMLNFDAAPIDEAFWRARLERAAMLRHDLLRLGTDTNAYRLIHAEGDDISGLVVDRYDDVLSIEVFSLGMWRIIDALLARLHDMAPIRHHLVQMDDRSQQQEGLTAAPIRSEHLPNAITIQEHGVRFRVQFDTGHKTGFFCDQRENRLRLASFCDGAEVLDLCSYTGGFGLYAKCRGAAKDVTCVDLDETAVALARKNADLNQVRINTIHADAFGYMRQMQTNNRTYDVVVLDPPKLIVTRQDAEEGRHKYADLNRLAATLVRPGGLLLTCSCSGLMQRDDFVSLVMGAVRRANRDSQILDVTGAGPDHPISSRCPESAYLKCAWMRVF